MNTSLNTDKLVPYLQQHIEGFSQPIRIEKFAGGQSNPTYKIDTKEKSYVLRRKPPGQLLKSAHAVDREFRVISALRGNGIPVAEAYHLCTDDEIISSWFYVMEYVEGRIFWDPALPEAKDNAERSAIYSAAIEILAKLTQLDLPAIGLDDYGRPGNYFERQIKRWSEQYRASETENLDAMNQLIDWLPTAVPSSATEACLIHGDFRLDNLIFHPTEPRVLAVLDWELSTLGHPLADLSYFSTCLRFPREGDITGLTGLDRGELGIPEETACLKQFCETAGIEVSDSDWRFYLAFNCFRFAAIVQGVYKRSLDGNASSDKAARVGALAKPVSAMGWQLANQ